MGLFFFNLDLVHVEKQTNFFPKCWDNLDSYSWVSSRNWACLYNFWKFFLFILLTTGQKVISLFKHSENEMCMYNCTSMYVYKCSTKIKRILQNIYNSTTVNISCHVCAWMHQLTCRYHVPCFQCIWLYPAGHSGSGKSSHMPLFHSRWLRPTECKACISVKHGQEQEVIFELLYDI